MNGEMLERDILLGKGRKRTYPGITAARNKVEFLIVHSTRFFPDSMIRNQ